MINMDRMTKKSIKSHTAIDIYEVSIHNKINQMYFRKFIGILICSFLLSINSHCIQEEKFKIATCQFPVTGDLQSNKKYIKEFIKEAASNGASIVHFSEAALTGYPPKDIPSFENYDWNALYNVTLEIMAMAKQFNIWVILGSAHFVADNEKPTNCLYIISNKGEIVDRYDKSMLTGGDQKYYTPGNHISAINIKGFECGLISSSLHHSIAVLILLTVSPSKYNIAVSVAFCLNETNPSVIINA